jgi:hypothetical protein
VGTNVGTAVDPEAHQELMVVQNCEYSGPVVFGVLYICFGSKPPRVRSVLGRLERSKSQPLATIPRHECGQRVTDLRTRPTNRRFIYHSYCATYP